MPKTLPANYFDQTPEAPKTLPANYFDQPQPDPSSSSEFKDIRDWPSRAEESGKNYLSGIGSAIRHPINAIESLGKTAIGLPLTAASEESTPPALRESRAMAKGVEDYYGERIRHPIETAYNDPFGTLGDTSMLAGGVAGAARLGAGVAGASRLGRALTTTGDVANAVSTYSNPLSLASRAVRAPLQAFPQLRENAGVRLYQSALKPALGGATSEDLANLSRTGMREEIPVSKGGLRKAQGKIADIENQVQPVLARGAAGGKTIDPNMVRGYLGSVSRKFANQVNPESDLAAIRDVGDEFLRTYPDPIPVNRAQEIKSGTYKQLEGKYNELSSANIEGQKGLARGVKSEVYNLFPELSALGPREGAIIDLEDAIDRGVAHHYNKDIARFPSFIAAHAGAAVGGPALGAITGATKWLIDTPYFKSRLAIALARRGLPAAQIRDYIVNAAGRLNTAESGGQP